MARTGRGWDAKPPDPRRAANRRRGEARSTPDTPPDAEPSGRRTSLPRSTASADSATPTDPAEPSGRRTSLPWSATPPAASAGSGTRGGGRRVGGRGQFGRGQSGDGQAGDGQAGDGQVGDGGQSGDEGRGKGGRGRWGTRRSGRDQAGGDTPEPKDPYELAREICLRQLSTRPRTRSELASALRKGGVEQEVANAVLDRYGEVGMIDDAAFARAWVTSRHHSKGLAGRALAQELRQRGVEQEVAQEALSELDAETEAETALELATRKLRSTRGEPEAVFRRLLGMLARKGYSGGVAVRAVKEAMATRDAELADLIDPDVYEE
ncbi:hypothetical protein Rhe02_90130 [Rhizocola hellebori]|uniref:Regulatory protein RecX n=1 Tax=Rhizocola hellebori TaxID=1392758 RepID=A0A8J3VM84_9ACTN|nr:hypothetical protein Rhe02_90130 [Rhizocola hellebori]